MRPRGNRCKFKTTQRISIVLVDKLASLEKKPEEVSITIFKKFIGFKGGPSDLGTKLLQKIREFLRPRSPPTEITVYFYMSSSVIYILEIDRRKFLT